MTEYINITVNFTIHLKNRIDKIAEKRMSNFSQVVREATSMGLEKME